MKADGRIDVVQPPAVAGLVKRIDAVLATYIDEPIFDLLRDCRAALSAQSQDMGASDTHATLSCQSELEPTLVAREKDRSGQSSLSAQSEPEPLTGDEFDRMMQYRAQKEAARGADAKKRQMREVLESLDKDWTAAFPGGPDDADSYLAPVTRTIWRNARAALAAKESP